MNKRLETSVLEEISAGIVKQVVKQNESRLKVLAAQLLKEIFSESNFQEKLKGILRITAEQHLRDEHEWVPYDAIEEEASRYVCSLLAKKRR